MLLWDISGRQYILNFSHVFISCLLPIVTANWQYKSRPDLSSPILNITVPPTSAVAPGYIFVAPYSAIREDSFLPTGPLQPAPYIFTSTGELVWSGFGYVGGWGANFQAATYQGQDVLFTFEGNLNNRRGHSHGHVKILNNKYETIKEVRSGSNHLLDLHEFKILDEKTALIESYHPTPYDLRAFGLEDRSQWIVDAKLQEVDIKTGNILFEWSSLDHVLPDETYPKPISALWLGTGHNSSDAIDYFHVNSVDRGDDGSYLVSGRHTSTIYKINGTSGEIIWRLGGQYSNFSLGVGADFGLQHHARFLSKSSHKDVEIISLFDNAGQDPSGKPESFTSAGKVLSLNTTSWRATLLQDFPNPDGKFSISQGSNQLLSNGNAFVNWGSGGAITEFDSDGAVIFHAYLESGELWKNGDVQSYRGFKFNWTGISPEAPAVKALKHGESTFLYVSWNGDTETRSWKFYGLDSEGKKRQLGQVERGGFETSFIVEGQLAWNKYLAEAIDAAGEVLVLSTEVTSEPYIHEYIPSKGDIVMEDWNILEDQNVLRSWN